MAPAGAILSAWLRDTRAKTLAAVPFPLSDRHTVAGFALGACDAITPASVRSLDDDTGSNAATLLDHNARAGALPRCVRPADRRARQRRPEPVGRKLRSRSLPARVRTSAWRPTPPPQIRWFSCSFLCCLSRPNGKRCNLFRARNGASPAPPTIQGVTIQRCDAPHSEATPGVRSSRCGSGWNKPQSAVTRS